MGIVKCPDCGGKVSDRISYCPHCGAPMSSSASTSRRPTTPRTQPVEPTYEDEYEAEGRSLRRGAWRGFWITFIVVMLAGGAALGYYYYKQEAEPGYAYVTSGLRDAANSYDVLGEFYDGIAQVKRDGEFFYINTDGELVDAPQRKEHAIHVADQTNLVRVESGGKWGMTDKTTGDTVISPQYSTLGNFYNGLAVAQIKYGDESMPEYKCYYGYVDTRGNHTFRAEQFEAIRSATEKAEKRKYIESLPKGVTTSALGLADGVKSVTMSRDSIETWTLTFDKKGVLTKYESTQAGRKPRHYGVSGGFPVSMTYEANDEIRSFTYKRERQSDTLEYIYCIGPDTRERVGEVRYDADNGTVVSFTFETLPSVRDESYSPVISYY